MNRQSIADRGNAQARRSSSNRLERAGRSLVAALTLWQREMVRFSRQRTRVVGALATPLVFWVLLGAGLDHAFVVRGADGAGMGLHAYLFPGTLVLILLFTAVYSTISVIEDRRAGFLQAVMVAPVSRLAIVTGKVLGGSSIATIQGTLFLLLWPLVRQVPGPAAGWVAAVAQFLVPVAVMFVLAMGLTALGLCIAWPMDSTAGFHAVMMVFLMPMWFLSGAVFPVGTAPWWLKGLMFANPLTYGHAVLARTLHGPEATAMGVPLTLAAPLMVGFTVALLLLAAALAARKSD